MKKHTIASKFSVLLLAVLAGISTGQTLGAATNPPPVSSVSNGKSSLGYDIYSIEFSGGSIAGLFSFLQTNGFGRDNVLIAGRAGVVYVPKFSVHNVRLREVAKAIEFVAEDRVKVEVVERGEAGDVNIWRIKTSDSQNQSVRACPIPRLLATGYNFPKGRERVNEVVDSVAAALNEQGKVRVLENEKIAVAVGSISYVEGVARALEAAEQAAAIAPGPIGEEPAPKPRDK